MVVYLQDVDFRIMLTFLEFYEVLLKFVMYKLYTSQNLRYIARTVSAPYSPILFV